MRDKILDATERLLARYGYAKMTVEDIAREAGIGKGTIYLHFPSKEEVVLSRVDRVVERLVEELRVIAKLRRPHADRLRSMLVTRVLVRFAYARRYAESMDEMLADIRAGLLARREKHFAAEAQVLAELLAEGKRAGAFAYKDVEEVAQALILATNALLPYSLTARQLGSRAAVEQKANTIATLLIDGLRRKA
jgi:AcrR family transcriptional regulator